MTTLFTLEGPMKKDQDYIDSADRKWITSARAAEIWNEKAQTEHNVKGNYTRWSVYQRREKLTRMNTPLGDLYLEDDIKSAELRPHPERPDVARRNRSRKKEISANPEN